MKQLRGRAGREVSVPVDECFAMLEAVEGYPSWFEYVRAVEVLKRRPDGVPARARAHIHVAQSPFGKDWELILALRAQRPSAIELTRLQTDVDDEDELQLSWRLEESVGTRIQFEFEAAVSFLPATVPLGDAGDRIAGRFVDAAASALADGTRA